MANVAVLAAGNPNSRVQNVDIATAPFPLITEGWVLSGVRTTSDVSGAIMGVGAFSNAWVTLITSAHSGTSPTLNVYLQQMLPNQATWQDIGSFTQVTVTDSKWVMQVTNGGSATQVTQDAGLSAGTMIQVPFMEQWRLKWVIAGTNPSYTFAAFAEFKK